MSLIDGAVSFTTRSCLRQKSGLAREVREIGGEGDARLWEPRTHQTPKVDVGRGELELDRVIINGSVTEPSTHSQNQVRPDFAVKLDASALPRTCAEVAKNRSGSKRKVAAASWPLADPSRKSLFDGALRQAADSQNVFAGLHAALRLADAHFSNEWLR